MSTAVDKYSEPFVSIGSTSMNSTNLGSNIIRIKKIQKVLKSKI